MFNVYYGGVDISTYGLLPMVVEFRPSIPGSVPKLIDYEIPGRDGALIQHEGAVEDIDIAINLSLVATPDTYMESYLEAVNEIYAVTDKWLYFSDDTFKYRVKYITFTDNSRLVKEAGRFTAVFRCEGYAYTREEIEFDLTHGGTYTVWSSSVSKPTFIISGSGLATITVNQKTVTANLPGSSQSIVIDTNLMVAYKFQDGSNLMTSVSGDLSELWFKHGENSVSVSGGLTRKLYYYDRMRT